MRVRLAKNRSFFFHSVRFLIKENICNLFKFIKMTVKDREI